MSETQAEHTAADQQQVLLAVFDDEQKAEAAVQHLIKADFPMDMVSLLGKVRASGDDPLGIYYSDVEERMKGWGAMGAFWGGLWGFFSGAAGMFLIPGVGPIVAAGPVVNAIVSALAGAGLTGGVMAGAAALSQLSVAMRRMGIPEEKLQELHNAIERGEYVVMLRLAPDAVGHWRHILSAQGARETLVFPFPSLLGES